jgi:5-methylcytosine-specific restriction endonuclease McrA
MRISVNKPTPSCKMYPKGFKHTTSREVSTYLRQMVLERDNWTCQICGKTIEEIQLHVHHMDPVAQNPMFQNDMDSCVTLCKICHKMVHSRRGCRYVDLQCKKK